MYKKSKDISEERCPYCGAKKVRTIYKDGKKICLACKREWDIDK